MIITEWMMWLIMLVLIALLIILSIVGIKEDRKNRAKEAITIDQIDQKGDQKLGERIMGSILLFVLLGGMVLVFSSPGAFQVVRTTPLPLITTLVLDGFLLLLAVAIIMMFFALLGCAIMFIGGEFWGEAERGRKE